MSKKTDPSLEGRCEIGKRAAAHGVRGDMLLIPLTDFPERYIGMKKLDRTLPGKPVKSWKVRRLEPYEGKNTFFLHLQGVEDRNAAEAMKNLDVYITEDDLGELPEDTFYIRDLIGLKVINAETGKEAGEIIDVIQGAAQDVYRIRLSDKECGPEESGGKGSRETMVPAVSEFVKDVNLEEKRVYIKFIEGML